MRVMVCVKQVIDVRTPLAVDRRRSTVTTPGIAPMISRADISAMEAGMGLKASIPEAEVIALSIGPASADAALRYCLARGTNGAWRVWDEGLKADDPYMVAEIIAQAARTASCSLILCGLVSDDLRSAIVPGVIAEKLCWPWVSRVVTLIVAQNAAAVTALQRGERGSRLEISCSLPAVIAFDPVLPMHQYVSIRRLQAAESKPIQTFSLDQLGLKIQEVMGIQPPVKVVKVRQPKPRTKRTVTASQHLSGEDMMWQMISGSSTKTEKNNLIRGNPAEVAERILEFLSEKGFVHQGHKESNKKEPGLP